MTYLDLIRDADRKLDKGHITLGEYEQMIEPMNREIQPERKHGKWERHYSKPNVFADLSWYCSVCGYKAVEYWTPYYNFCPDCGANMKGIKEHERSDKQTGGD